MLHRLLGVFFLLTGLSGPILLQEASSPGKPAGPTRVMAASKPCRIGVYYFDGWSGLTREHITPVLLDSFPEREPAWGWITSTQKILEQQIDAAADGGISFFNFCWYYPEKSQGGFRTTPLNRALSFYLKAPNRQRLGFSLLVANHGGSRIGPNEWALASQEWLRLFQTSTYVRVNDRPLISFFSVQTLVDAFGSPEAVRQAFDQLRTAARQQGLPGVTVAACVPPDRARIDQARRCGFDVLTGYNYHGAGFRPGQVETPIDSLIANSRRYWAAFEAAGLPYMPVVTLNWDHRPWDKPGTVSQRYTGFSAQSVFRSVLSAREWLALHPKQTTAERIAMVYAWNEYGEGAWLTPSRNDKLKLLDGIRRAVK